MVIERHIGQLDLPATLMRPVSFMENYVDPAFGPGRHPDVLTFDAWLAAGGAARLTALPADRTP